jgi:hypothetical protein
MPIVTTTTTATIAETTDDGSNRLRSRGDAATQGGTPIHVEYNVP